MKSGNYAKYLKSKWKRERLSTYKTLRKLRDDPKFRHKWVKKQLRGMKEKDPTIDEATQYDLMLAYLEEFDFRIIEEEGRPPTVHVEPRKFRGTYFSKILGIKSENLSTCLNSVARSAAEDIIRGYGKTAVLGNVFGKEYRNKLNRWIKKEMEEEYGQ